MSPTVQRREFLTALGAGIAGLAGCVGNLPGTSGGVDRTIYVGAYHWGFIIVDESGEEQDRISLQRNDVLRVVSFNTLASQAVQSLPASIRDALPDHEALEERNEERIPAPADGDFHELLEEANEQYPDHSLAIMPSGQVHMGGGMMMHPVALPQNATRSIVRQLGATQRGDYTLSCLTYCGYGHPYMEIDGGIVIT
ncbi:MULTISPECIES: hypothetical protein [Halobacteriales]|jgi:hypothetical protein|uniref:Uncharacterized protein n=2 Tax=Halobacteriales TaxID=2235 RepID=A0A1I2W0M8_9EURY|nr:MULTISPECIES: hypothetical protein [Halobacteria]MDF9748175.1 hypothetical protein [Natrinema salsiterrestre]SFG95008.1 hypothetical protein SAMN04488063_3379 [Halopelagius inordinatus]